MHQRAVFNLVVGEGLLVGQLLSSINKPLLNDASSDGHSGTVSEAVEGTHLSTCSIRHFVQAMVVLEVTVTGNSFPVRV